MINPKELLFVVDENNKPLEPLPRDEVHSKGIWHRSTNMLVLNGDKLLCEKRSFKKDTSPGKWQICFGGHLNPGEEYLETASRELQEEAGISLPPEDFKLRMVYKYSKVDKLTGAKDNEFLGVFTVNWDGGISELKLEADEVEKAQWFSLDELKDAIANTDNWVDHGYEAQLIEELINERRK